MLAAQQQVEAPAGDRTMRFTPLPSFEQEGGPRVKSIYYPQARYGSGFEGVKSRLHAHVSEVKGNAPE